MNRLERLRGLEDHAYYGKMMAELSCGDRAVMEHFIMSCRGKSRDSMISDINRLFVDVQNKPKRWKQIMELLTCVA